MEKEYLDSSLRKIYNYDLSAARYIINLYFEGREAVKSEYFLEKRSYVLA